MKDLLPHQEHVVTEKAQLDQKILRYGMFLDLKTIQDFLGIEDYGLMKEELEIMKSHSDILQKRIKRFYVV